MRKLEKNHNLTYVELQPLDHLTRSKSL
jgi:hypothetical protein